MILPLIIYGSILTTFGGYIGYNNAREKSVELLGNLAKSIQVTINSRLDIKYFALFIILSMIPFMVMLLLRIRQLKSSSVIDLINNNKGKKVAQGEAESLEVDKGTAVMTIKTKTDIKEPVNSKEQYIKKYEAIAIGDSKKSLRRFSLNHTIRSKVTSMLLIVLAGIFTFSLLWMSYLVIRNNDFIEKAYSENVVTGDIITMGDAGSSKVEVGPITGRHIDNLFETGLVQSYFGIAELLYQELYIDRDGVVEKYEAGEKDTVHFLTRKPTFNIYASNKSYNGDNGGITLTELTFLEGYSLKDFDKEYIGDYTDRLNPIVANKDGKEGFPVLASNAAMEHFDLKIGDKVFLEPNPRLRKLSIESYGTIVGTFKGIDREKDFYGYSGINREIDLFIYPISALQSIERELYYNKLEIEFKTEKNKELMDRKDEIRKIVAGNPFNDFPTELNIWDGELTNVVEPLEKNISLLEVLYPITFILSIVIASILAFMMVLRRSTDVAILRILGVKEKEVQWNLFRENIVLVLIGIVVSLIIILSITANSYPIDLLKYAMVIGGYLLGTIVGLILGIGKVTNKKPLEMLQVKE